MLQTIFFYLFAGWFVKLKTARALKIRIIIATVLAIGYFIGTIAILVIECGKVDGAPQMAAITIVLMALMLFRIGIDAETLHSDEIQEAAHITKKVKQQNKDITNYKKLIEKCGIKFFIKYYNQIKRLPLRDVGVEENYSSQEREERLNAAKQIIDLDLTELTLEESLKAYGDMLSESEVAAAKIILSQIPKQVQPPPQQVVQQDDIVEKETCYVNTLFKDDYD